MLRKRYRESIDAIVNSVSTSIYYHDDGGRAWERHLKSISPAERYLANVQRRLGEGARMYREQGKCLYCWFPLKTCCCESLPLSPVVDWGQFSGAGRSGDDKVVVQLDVVLVLHSDEMWRVSNTGRLLAMVLDAPILIWGIPQHDAILAELTPHDHCVLFPDSSALSVPQVLQRCLFDEAIPSSTGGATESTEVACPPGSSGSIDERMVQKGGDASCASVTTKRNITLVIADSTWSQACRVNKRIPPAVPRIALDIDKDHKNLFALRKATREGGVSTLEASAMALVELTRELESGAKLHYCSLVSANSKMAHSVEPLLIDVMKQHVDRVLEAKNYKTLHDESRSPEDQEQYRKGLKQYGIDRNNLAREKVLGLSADRLEELKLPPVLNFCPYCTRFVGWWRMQDHVTSRRHMSAFDLAKAKAASHRRNAAGSEGDSNSRGPEAE